jgi:hypothetical protein
MESRGDDHRSAVREEDFIGIGQGASWRGYMSLKCKFNRSYLIGGK